MHNPFLASRNLREGQLIAYPPAPRTDLLTAGGTGYVNYRSRYGDNILHIARVLETDRERYRDENRLWRLQTLPAGQVLRIPLERERRGARQVTYRVLAGDDIGAIAERHNTSAWRIVRDNGLWDEVLTPGALLQIEREPPRPAYATHRVRSGDTLGALARRYGTSVRAIQAANNMGRRTVIAIGQQLRMPTGRGNAAGRATGSFAGARRTGRAGCADHHAPRSAGRDADGHRQALRHLGARHPDRQRHGPPHRHPGRAAAPHPRQLTRAAAAGVSGRGRRRRRRA